MATVTGSFRLVERVALTTFSPITVTGAVSLPLTAEVTVGGSGFSLIPITPASLTLTPAAPTDLGVLSGA